VYRTNGTASYLFLRVGFEGFRGLAETAGLFAAFAGFEVFFGAGRFTVFGFGAAALDFLGAFVVPFTAPFCCGAPCTAFGSWNPRTRSNPSVSDRYVQISAART
jgi:hypothetical protein